MKELTFITGHPGLPPLPGIICICKTCDEHAFIFYRRLLSVVKLEPCLWESNKAYSACLAAEPP
jgi:hypothetical protein